MKKRLSRGVLVLLSVLLFLSACKGRAPKVEVVPPPMPAEAGEQWWLTPERLWRAADA